ncbi:hypothetical protein SeMB42_g04721 [Synchytrium endobioticum]|uniref:OPA3-like protein n=1 Tax=Synchytrium endobioticum TaxID=286115 RepID=A0A507CWM1_9FUNG|nr:hypothetical protein SeLEV6574_g05901 [Synchytrium endobioticum]TPX43441.1 hypothetical protein SeMB42_g04721 [Synchytrium endobioticum]
MATSIKFGTLLVRTIAKPIATAIRNQAKQHERFKEVCIGLAQWTHKVEMNLKMNFFGYKVEAVRPLNDAKAIELGANFISEGIIFSVAAFTIGFETWRSRKNTNARHTDVDEALERLDRDTQQFKLHMDSLKQQLVELRKDNERLHGTLERVAHAVNIRLERERDWNQMSWTQKLMHPFKHVPTFLPISMGIWGSSPCTNNKQESSQPVPQ